MMARRLAGFLAILGFTAMLAVWVCQQLNSLPSLPLEDLIPFGIAILLGYFIWGIFIAKLGIDIVQEIIQERRSQLGQRHRLTMVRREESLGEGAPSEADKGGGGGGEASPPPPPPP